MTMCITGKTHCHCQPDEGQFCCYSDEVAHLQSEVERLRGRLHQINNLVALRWSNGVPTHSEMLEEVEQLSKLGAKSAQRLRQQAAESES